MDCSLLQISGLTPSFAFFVKKEHYSLGNVGHDFGGCVILILYPQFDFLS